MSRLTATWPPVSCLTQQPEVQQQLTPIPELSLSPDATGQDTAAAPRLSINTAAHPHEDETLEPRTRTEEDAQAAGPATADKNWKAEYAKLSAKFNALSGNFKKAREALRKRKDERDQWIQHAALLEKKIRAAQEEHGIQILDLNGRHDRASSHIDENGGAIRTSPDASFASDGAPEPTDPPAPSGTLKDNPPPAARESHEPHEPPPPSDSTQSEASRRVDEYSPLLAQDVSAGEVKIKEEPSSDPPVFVSERSLGKRKRALEPTEPPAAFIKAEPGLDDSSSPDLTIYRYDFNPHESPDLGEVAQTMHTPRKRRDIDRSPSATILTQKDARRNSFAGTPDSVDPHLSSLGPKGKDSGKRRRKGLGRGIGVLAEDGATYETNSIQASANTAGVGPGVKSRLGALLDSPSYTEYHTFTTPTARGQQGTPPVTGQEGLSIPKPRELPFEKVARQGGKHSGARTPQSPRTPLADATNTARINRVRPQSTKPTVSLLRKRPVSELRLDDFKINPRANDGHDFAYSEVVRDKGGRACLPGCVDMHCCGKEFRALALSERPDPPLTGAQRQEEQRLLEEYLGDYSYRLATMSKEERAELWLEAKTRELANRFGKHRHRFSRMRSPPGFWNPDFPSTQELEAEKAEAAKRERQAVQDRYREAMRPGGRWTFRDE